MEEKARGEERGGERERGERGEEREREREGGGLKSRVKRRW